MVRRIFLLAACHGIILLIETTLIIQAHHFFNSQVRAATAYASTATCSVGMITGANKALWLIGTSPGRPSAAASSNILGSVPP